MKKVTTRDTFAPTFPRESSNLSQDNGALADTGNTNDFTANRPVPSQRINEILGGFTDSAVVPSDARIAAAVTSAQGGDRQTQVDAIKRDWLRTKMRQAQQFASGPAAASNANDLGNP